MKRLLTKLTLLLTVALFAGAVNAQVAATADVTADVVTALEITPVADVAFGNVELGTSPVLEPQGTGHVATSGTAGEFTVAGENGAAITVTYTDATLEDASANSLSFTTQLSESSDGTQGTSTDIASGGSITLDADGWTLYVGGALDLTGAVAGSYSTATGSGSPVQVTVAYQ